MDMVRGSLMDRPISVIVDHRDRMIVADYKYYNHRIVILDQNGSWLLTINYI